MFKSVIDKFEDYTDDSDLQAEWIESSDGSNPLLEVTNKLDGAQSAKFSWVNSSGTARWDASPTGRDVQRLTGNRLGAPTQGYIKGAIKLGQVGAVSTIKIQAGSNSSNYTEVSFTPSDSTEVQEFELSLASGSTTGSPYWQNMDYIAIIVNESDDGYVIVDNLELKKDSTNLKVRINGIDRGEYIDKKSFSLKSVINDEVDTLFFDLKVEVSELSYIKPSYDDIVKVYYNGTNIFSGKVKSIIEKEIGFQLYKLEITVKDFSSDLTRFRVVDVFEDVTDLYNVNNIINDYLNTDYKVIDGMESGWSSGTSDTDNYMEGSQSLMINNTSTNKAISLDLTKFSNNNSSDTSDYIEFWYYIDDSSSLTSIQIKLGDSGLSNYFSKTVSSGFSDGWNLFRYKKSEFTTTGSPAWGSIAKVELVSTGATDVSFDDIRLISNDSFDKSYIELSSIDVKYLPFNYIPAFQALQDLCKYTGKYWYIDESKGFHYFSAGFEVAPFEITDTNGNMLKNSLIIEEDGTQIKNKVYVRGGMFLSSTRYEKVQLGDGNLRTFQVDYTGTDLRVFVDTGSGYVQKTVGLDNIDTDDGTYDWFWNNSEKIIKQASAGTTLTSSDKIKIDLYPYLPVIVQIPDYTSIAEYGVHEMLIIDKNIKTKEGARERAVAELEAYKNTLKNAQLSTLTDGLKAGQLLKINSSNRNINKYFVIWSLTIQAYGYDKLLYKVVLIDKNKLTLVNTLIQLLLEKTKTIEVDSNESLDKYKPHYEDVLIQETHTVTLSTTSTCKWGSHADQGTYTTHYVYS